MTRRDWVLALAATWGVGLLPGCQCFSRSPCGNCRPVEIQAAGNAPTVLPPAKQFSSPVVATPADAVPPEAPAGPTNADLPPPPAPPAGPAFAKGPESNRPSAERAVHYPTDPSWYGLLRPAETVPSPELSPLAPSKGQAIPIFPKPDADPPLVAAMRCMLDKRPDDAAARLQDFDKANQEVLLCLLPLAARLSLGSLDRTAPGELAMMVDQADGVAAPLRRRAPLVIDKMSLCRRIDKFGQYEPLSDQHNFHPGELVQVYAELRNFSSEAGKGGFEIRLASSVRLTCPTAAGGPEVVWRQDFHDRERVDRSRSPRRDYFNNYRFCIPENIPPGSYKLWLKVIDVPTGRSAEGSLPLVVTYRRGA